MTTSLADYPEFGERVYEVIREQILTVVLPPGGPISTVEMARRLGVSRTPVTTALNRLAAEGLVDVVPRKGYFVATLDVEDYVKLLEARLMVELAVAEQAVEVLEPAALVRMRTLLREMEQCLDGQGRHSDYHRWVKTDAEFHQALIQSAKNPHIEAFYRQLGTHAHIARLFFASKTMEHRPAAVSLRESRAILEALESRDLPSLQQAIFDHLSGTAEFFCGTNVASRPAWSAGLRWIARSGQRLVVGQSKVL